MKKFLIIFAPLDLEDESLCRCFTLSYVWDPDLAKEILERKFLAD
jgi:hypothetical protein